MSKKKDESKVATVESLTTVIHNDKKYPKGTVWEIDTESACALIGAGAIKELVKIEAQNETP